MDALIRDLVGGRRIPPEERERWGRGPWNDEPDFGIVEHCGFTGFIKRSWSGALCGYVAVPEGHPWHGLGFTALSAVDVHGDLTFSNPMGPYWCLGFDCGHGGDLTPLFAGLMQHTLRGWSYKDFTYVTNEVKSLCEQAFIAEEPLDHDLLWICRRLRDSHLRWSAITSYPDLPLVVAVARYQGRYRLSLRLARML